MYEYENDDDDFRVFLEDLDDDTLTAVGELVADVGRARQLGFARSMVATDSAFISRSFGLADADIIRGRDGNVVRAYCAVFDKSAEIRDQHGHYMERIDRAAFNRAISRGIGSVKVFYNHGAGLNGQPSALGSVPIGTPLDIRPDGKGLLTETRYNNSDLARAVLEGIHDGQISGYSFRGRVLRSEPARVPRSSGGGELPTVTRHELGLSEYGPTPFPYYADAAVVRAA